jgi:hypothetical protein
MSDYRVYIIGPDGHVIDRVDLLCDNEAEARLAKQLVAGRDVELWQLDRMIETFRDTSNSAAHTKLVGHSRVRAAISASA